MGGRGALRSITTLEHDGAETELRAQMRRCETCGTGTDDDNVDGLGVDAGIGHQNTPSKLPPSSCRFCPLM